MTNNPELCTGRTHYKRPYYQDSCQLCGQYPLNVCRFVEGCTGCCGRLTVIANAHFCGTAIIFSLHDERCMSTRDCVCGVRDSMDQLAVAIQIVMPKAQQFYKRP